MKQPDWGMGTSCYKSSMAGTSLDEKKSQFDWPTGDTSFHSKQILVHTRELDCWQSVTFFSLEISAGIMRRTLFSLKENGTRRSR